jgi:hypothetical protein
VTNKCRPLADSEVEQMQKGVALVFSNSNWSSQNQAKLVSRDDVQMLKRWRCGGGEWMSRLNMMCEYLLAGARMSRLNK